MTGHPNRRMQSIIIICQGWDGNAGKHKVSEPLSTFIVTDVRACSIDTSGGGFRALHLDGAMTMDIVFPDQATYHDWMARTGDIKAVGEAPYMHLAAVEHQHDCMLQEHQHKVIEWLQSITDLRAMGFGVPPQYCRGRDGMVSPQWW